MPSVWACNMRLAATSFFAKTAKGWLRDGPWASLWHIFFYDWVFFRHRVWKIIWIFLFNGWFCAKNFLLAAMLSMASWLVTRATRFITSQPSFLLLLGNYSIAFCKNWDQTERVLPRCQILAFVSFEEVLQLYLTAALFDSVWVNATRLSDDLSDFISTYWVGHTCALLDSFLFSEISLQVVLSVWFELSV